MQQKSPKIFPRITLKRAFSLSHSRLYHLEPIGSGTPLVESLTSYLCRLANAHCWLAGTLMRYEVAPAINKPYMLARVTTIDPIGCGVLGRSSDGMKTINGTETMASTFIEALESLTLRPDLRFLTLLPWKDVLISRYLLRNFKAWCPNCFHDWRAKKQVIYEPLIWAIEAVRICLHHRRLLTMICPHCDKKVLHLTYGSRPGYCPRCENWLGSKDKESTSKAQQMLSDELKCHLWIVGNVGQLLEASTILPRACSRENIVRSLRACIHRTNDGTSTRFAAMLGKRKNTVWGWWHGYNRPSFIDLLQICFRVGYSLAEFLTANENIINNATPLKITPINLPITLKTTHRKEPLDMTNVGQELMRFLDDEIEPVSVAGVARLMGCDVRTLYKLFPELCKQISSRYAIFRNKRAIETKDKMYEEVRRAVIELAADGIYPSRSNVAGFLNKPQYKNSGIIIPALREALRSLNYPSKSILKI